MRNLLKRIGQGTQKAKQEWHQGKNTSTMIRDLAEGNTFYRNASFSDDAANREQERN